MAERKQKVYFENKRQTKDATMKRMEIIIDINWSYDNNL